MNMSIRMSPILVKPEERITFHEENANHIFISIGKKHLKNIERSSFIFQTSRLVLSRANILDFNHLLDLTVNFPTKTTMQLLVSSLGSRWTEKIINYMLLFEKYWFGDLGGDMISSSQWQKNLLQTKIMRRSSYIKLPTKLGEYKTSRKFVNFEVF